MEEITNLFLIEALGDLEKKIHGLAFSFQFKHVCVKVKPTLGRSNTRYTSKKKKEKILL